MSALANRVARLARQHRRQEGRCRCIPRIVLIEEIVNRPQHVLDSGAAHPSPPAERAEAERETSRCPRCGGYNGIRLEIIEEIVEAPTTKERRP